MDKRERIILFFSDVEGTLNRLDYNGLKKLKNY